MRCHLKILLSSSAPQHIHQRHTGPLTAKPTAKLPIRTGRAPQVKNTAQGGVRTLAAYKNAVMRVLLYDVFTDPNGNFLNFELLSQPPSQEIAVDGEWLRFHPVKNFVGGPLPVQLKASDGHASAETWLNITTLSECRRAHTVCVLPNMRCFRVGLPASTNTHPPSCKPPKLKPAHTQTFNAPPSFTETKPPYIKPSVLAFRRLQCKPWLAQLQLQAGMIELINGKQYGLPKGIEMDVGIDDNTDTFDQSNTVCSKVKVSGKIAAYAFGELPCKSGACKKCLAKLNCTLPYKLRARAQGGDVGVNSDWHFRGFTVDCPPGKQNCL